ncbi:anthranilate synthase component II [Heyndrickxia acidicola]|uniref:Aminodeoxychorismate/anthranilate synthase component II n=1 Tax=Heyndrickxia acidicola TaxID=209389 RepID=A0ABU6MKV2_9BACI|nr:aminodeoxychorismate/anthranilate synthase component II [Heyndrickxia acidicola]MED1203867.1 aminodeoxychorismate/anthranilate synthase component II [Heyndrickxia acidicola]
MLLVIDNYDSFTYNLVQYIKQLGIDVTVARNDVLTIQDIVERKPDAILISPGPGNPSEAGISLEAIHAFYNKLPILGICLGHQTIAQAFGGSIIKAIKPMHGKVSTIQHDGKSSFQGIPSPFRVARYHSLVVDSGKVPDCLEVTALSENGEIMGIRHREYPVEGLQFHPEAIMTEHGLKLLENFFKAHLSASLHHQLIGQE